VHIADCDARPLLVRSGHFAKTDVRIALKSGHPDSDYVII
jgi:hypothetical protein